MCECDKIVKKCIGAINKFFYLDRVDKTKIRHYTDLNNIANKKIRECIELAHEYQQENGITGECITNSILLCDILKCFGYDNYYPRLVLSVGGYDLGERYTPHMITYSRDTDTILDMSYVNYWEVKERDFYFSFAVNKILSEATDKKIITAKKRFDIYNNFYGLDESRNETVLQLDYHKQTYYNELLKYIKDNTNYDELTKLELIKMRKYDFWTYDT